MATSQPFEFRRSRDFGESFSALFEFLRRNWKNLLQSLIFIAGPLILIMGVGGGFLISEIFSVLQQTSFGSPDFLVKISEVVMKGFILWIVYFLTGASVLAITCEYIQLSVDGIGEQFTVSLLWSKITSHFWRHVANFIAINSVGLVMLLPFAIIIGVLGGAGLGGMELVVIFYLLMFFVGLPLSIYITIVLSLFPMMRMSENIGVFAGIKRCFFLIKNNFWATVGYYIIVGLIQGVVGMIFTIPFYIMYFIAIITVIPQSGQMQDGTALFSNFGTGFQIAFTIAGVIAVGGSLLLNSIMTSAHALQYFNLVERKEGVGMMAKLEQLGTPESPTDEQENREEY